MNDALTDEIRRTLRTAADRLDITPPPFSTAQRARSITRSPASRWVWPVAAAAAVVAVALLVVAFVMPSVADRRLAAAATTVAVADGIGEVGGVRFPVPTGWTVAVTSSTDDAVTACVALAPAPDCDGVELAMATPDTSGSGEPLTTAAMFAKDCSATTPHHIQIEESVSVVGGRPAVHYRSYCGDSGPEENLWQLTDLTLFVSTPTGRWADEGTLIAGGLDLHGWPVEPGPQRAFMTSATSAN